MDLCCLVPGSPEQFIVKNSELNSTAELVTSWKKPSGGNVISGYYLQWMSDTDDDAKTNQTWIYQMLKKRCYKHTIIGLKSGTRYVVKIIAYNDAGNGTAISNKIATGINW